MKKRISSILSLNLIVFTIITSLYCVPAKAGFVENMQEAKEATLALQDYITSTYPVQGNEKIDRYLKSVTLPLGYIVGYATFSQATYREIMNSKNYGGIVINSSDSDEVANKKYAEALTNNIIVSDNNIYINDVGRQIIDDYTTYINNNSPYFYAQSIDISNSASSFSNQVLYNAIRSEIQAHQRDYFCLLSRTGDFDLYFVKKDAPIAFILKRTTNQGTYDVDAISTTTGNYVYYINLYNSASENVIKKHFNAESGYFESQSTIESSSTVSQVLAPNYQKSFGSSFINASGYRVSFTYNDFYTVKVYKSKQDWLDEVIQQAPYFISNNYYNYSNTTGDYNINSGNANTITMGDITGYINSYNQENGTNPTPQQIEIYINNNVGTPDPTPTPTPTPTTNPEDPGGGGGSGGNESGDTGIFDFLSRLGEVLGNLIKNLGEMLTSLIDGIVETVSSVLESIPNIFTPLIDYVFGGLPAEVRAMIILGISCMVIIGVIKAFKG